MNAVTIMARLGEFLGMVPPEVRDKVSELLEQKLKEAVDDALDYVENMVEESETQWDDVTVGKIITLFREQMEIPDNIGGDKD